MSSDRLVFFGTDAFSVPSLMRLLAEDWPVAAVITKPDAPTGRGRKLASPAVKLLAEAQNIPVFQPKDLSEIASHITRLRPTAGVVVAYGKIIPESFINLFPKGLVNVHASLLPRWRGASPIENALLAGDKDTGVTLMSIEPGLDTGPTYTSEKIQLAGLETRVQLYVQLAEIGANLLASDLNAILTGTITAIPQNSSEATVTKQIPKAAGTIDWTKTAAQLEREVRAYLGWPGSRTSLMDTQVTITAARALGIDGPAGTPYVTPSRELAVYASTGSLVIDALKPAGKSEMPGTAFLTGHPVS